MSKIIVVKITSEKMIVYNQLSRTAKVFRDGKYKSGDCINFSIDYTPERFEQFAINMRNKLKTK
jgi:hypothetical protein